MITIRPGHRHELDDWFEDGLLARSGGAGNGRAIGHEEIQIIRLAGLGGAVQAKERNRMFVPGQRHTAFAGNRAERLGQNVIGGCASGRKVGANARLVRVHHLHEITALNHASHAVAITLKGVLGVRPQFAPNDGRQKDKRGDGGHHHPTVDRDWNAGFGDVPGDNLATQALRHGNGLEFAADGVEDGALLLEPGGEFGVALDELESGGHLRVGIVRDARAVEHEDFFGLVPGHAVPFVLG